MAGYCGRCGQHYDCHYSQHEEECSEQRQPNPDSRDEMFAHEKAAQGWPDDMDEQIWNEHFRNVDYKF